MATDLRNTIWTIGHSTRSFEDFVDLLIAQEIALLVDIRRYPGSRKFPHFKKEHLEMALPEKGIGYQHLEDLGGRRSPKKDSVNAAWRLASFRGYADYMETEAFQAAADQLQELAREKRTAMMCSEAVWWSCHRSLVSDYLKVRDWTVLHIMGQKNTPEHPYTKPAQVVDGLLTYSKEETTGDEN